MVYEPPRPAITSKRARREWDAELSSREASEGVRGKGHGIAGYLLFAILLVMVVVLLVLL